MTSYIFRRKQIHSLTSHDRWRGGEHQVGGGVSGRRFCTPLLALSNLTRSNCELKVLIYRVATLVDQDRSEYTGCNTSPTGRLRGGQVSGSDISPSKNANTCPDQVNNSMHHTWSCTCNRTSVRLTIRSGMENSKSTSQAVYPKTILWRDCKRLWA